jgi:hypothetical protein
MLKTGVIVGMMSLIKGMMSLINLIHKFNPNNGEARG